MRIVRAADWVQVPWKNGGGTTAEIATGPHGAGFDEFDWRISAARVERAGPFSNFAGIERTLCVLEGDGLLLSGPELGRVTLTAASAPLVFDGAWAIEGDLVGGPVLDLNVMVRQGRYRSVVRRVTGAERAAGTIIVVHCTSDRILVDGTVLLGRGDSVVVEGAASVRSGEAIVVELIATGFEDAI